jgi:regulator of sigma E protease
MLAIGIITGFLILMGLVVVHEWGHFIMARKNGVVVEEFGIGMPPRAKAWKLKSGMEFSLNWLPLGGFCKLKGESDSDKRKNTFGSASYWGKTKILFGGVMMNWIAAIIIFSVLAVVGMPLFMQNQFQMSGGQIVTDNVLTVAEVQPDSPAAVAGMAAGDQIVWLGEESQVLQTWETNLSEWTAAHAGETVEIGVRAPGEETRTAIVALNPTSTEGYYLGVSSRIDGSIAPMYQAQWWQAPIVGVVTTVQLTGETFKGVGELLWNLVAGIFKQVSTDGGVREEGRQEIGKAGDGVSGPVGIVGVLFPAFASAGLRELGFLAGLISLSLAVMNVLPIPAMDGGRWLLITIYKLRRKVLTVEKEEKIVGTSFAILLGLFAVITILDITRFFK